MNGKDLHDAVAFVGQDLIDLAEKQHFGRSTSRILLPMAASLLLIAGLTAIGAKHIPPQPPVPIIETHTQTEAPLPTQELPPQEESPAEPTPMERLTAAFPQLNSPSVEAYLLAHPDLDTENLCMNEAGLDDTGTDLYTTQGDQILAIDMRNEILLIRVTGEGYQGVLALANHPTRLMLQPSSQLGVAGETIGTIAQTHNGILAISASGFLDEDGSGNGGQLFGYAMHSGVSCNENSHLSEPYRRLEITQDGQFRLTGIQEDIRNDVEHALEFGPALIKNGAILVDETCGYTGIHPRAAIGQGENGQIMMLVIEGRMAGYSLGTDVIQCAEILSRYGCRTALNLDGGTSAILWYDGEYVTKCSNPDLPEGRLLPNAFVIQAN